jgi:DNA polymerase-3 subunit delta'
LTALEAIEGQPRAVALLRRALAADRVAHAYAFLGPAGSGRMTTALAFAQAILCREVREAGAAACGGCRACALVAARQHPDLHVIVPTPPDKNPRGPRAIRIDDLRELERRAALKPAMARTKVFILDDADRMTGESPQAFLKTLEEPPAQTVLVLVLSRARAVPATVLSRCQLVRFAPRQDGAALTLRHEARAILDQVRHDGMGALLARPDRLERERAEGLVDAYWTLCRDLLLARSGAPPKLLGGPEEPEALVREADAWSVEELLATLELCREARAALAVNVSPRLTLEVLVSRLAGKAA